MEDKFNDDERREGEFGNAMDEIVNSVDDAGDDVIRISLIVMLIQFIKAARALCVTFCVASQICVSTKEHLSHFWHLKHKIRNFLLENKLIS